MVDRSHKELSDEEISRITQNYHAWRGEKEAEEYQDILGFCKSATIVEIANHDFVLTPGRFVGAEEAEEDNEIFEEKMQKLGNDLTKLLKQDELLKELVKTSLKMIGINI